MNTCKTCRYWGLYLRTTLLATPVSAIEARECESPLLLRLAEELEVSNQAMMDDNATFWTGPDFGCVNWEQGEDTL